MPGTGPLRRSSAPARIKALVRKLRFKAGAPTKPTILIFSARVTGRKMLGFWGGFFLSPGKANRIGGGRFK